ncbi:Methyltransferase type 11 [Gloeothece citriformis PCC 7424]|uniref:Methyltransferase type 11 n=1 Tax=Gloeothece citriformis (strain PCC 7424) TaxID=65393 RepID=B7KJA8_GLOC7|nr:class I SAM-dependent methyltransferase [Gloeothece citriformis]ACK72192.1 Methyltransferase type 11 [Gloeothece citriformis PCC 7424]
MTNIVEKIRQQFDSGPYPRIAIDQSPKNDISQLYVHNLTTATYRRNKQIVDPSNKLILDVACGTGFTTLCLAEANPGAKIIGVDISEESVKLARERLSYHGFNEIEFYCMSLEDLPSLGLEFDYINAEEVLYILPDIVKGLVSMKTVLKPAGIIRTNLHSYYQRLCFYQAQTIFKMMGLMDENPAEMEVDIVRDFFKALKDRVQLKTLCWKPHLEKQEQYYMMNFLFQGDTGFTIPQLFNFLEASDLEFISMVNWRQWNLLELFQDPENLPTFLALTLPEASIEEQLHLYELINPNHRLLDFWCGHPLSTEEISSPEDWTKEEWQTVKVYVHPQVKTEIMQEAILEAIKNLQPFELGKYWPPIKRDTLVDNSLLACLLPPLLDSPKPFNFLVKHWQTLHPIDPLTLNPTTDEEAFNLIRQFLINQEKFDYILLEKGTTSP